jgi:predicted GIY-YIG superfamily endonuclease
MYKLYYIVSDKTDSYYIGMTKNKLSYRLNSHKSAARSKKKTALYDCMRKYGLDNFIICLKDEFDTHNECCDAEIRAIKLARKSNHKILNLADGGEGGFNVINIESWKNKLKEKRKGRKPALGMSHTDDNKKLFSDVSRKYWDSQNTYSQDEIIKLSFKEAKQKYGISKTHYYRLKRVSSND